MVSSEAVEGLAKTEHLATTISVSFWLSDIELSVNEAMKEGVLDITLLEGKTASNNDGHETANRDEATDRSVGVAIVNLFTVGESLGNQTGLVEVVGTIRKFAFEHPLGADRNTAGRKRSTLPSTKALKHLVLFVCSLLPPERILTHCLSPCGRSRRFKNRRADTDRISGATLQGVHLKIGQTLTTAWRRTRGWHDQ